MSTFKLPLKEKIGYAMGDAAANFYWRSAFFLPIFYTDTFGLSAAQATILILLVRLSDGITDIFMGSIADRTQTTQGKFRPWILWSSPVLGVFLALVFTTPDIGATGKLIYAYVIYFGLTLAYTANNVPYGALMGVMTSSVNERASLASFRFIGAFGGGLMVMTLLPFLVDYFGEGDKAEGYQQTMLIFAILLVVFNVITYKTTKERITLKSGTQGALNTEMVDLIKNLPVIFVPILGISAFIIALSQSDWSKAAKVYAALFCLGSFVYTVYLRNVLIHKPESTRTRTQSDLADLLNNKPWLILLVLGVLFGLFTVVRPSSAAYYFKWYLGREDLLSIYFFTTLIGSLVAAWATGYLTNQFSKRGLLAIAFLGGAIFSALIYIVDPQQTTLMMTFAIIGEFFAGMMPVLFFGMLGDTVDYSEWKNGRRATGLVYSAGTFINKTGHGFAGALALVVLTLYGYNPKDPVSIENSLDGIRLLMSLIPAIICVLGLAVVFIYPLSNKKMIEIESDLAERRKD